MLNYFDIHSHLNFFQFDEDREQIIAEMKKRGFGTITVGTDLTTSGEAIALAEKHENFYAAIGLHPMDTIQGFSPTAFEALISHPKVVAVGECGLDYNRLAGDTEASKLVQKGIFEQQIELAVAHDKPLMIHCREAYVDTLEIIKSRKAIHGDKLRGNFHFFVHSIEVARQCFDLGFTISFTGPITFSNDYDDVVEFAPIEKIMTETDAPFAAPEPYRGKRNSPLYVEEVVKKVAAVKKLDLDMVKKKMVDNVFDHFLKKSLA